MAMSNTLILIIVVAYIALASSSVLAADDAGGLRRRNLSASDENDKAKLEEEFKGVKVVDVDESPEEQEQPEARKADKGSDSVPAIEKAPKKKFARFKFKKQGKNYRRPLAQPDACCCPCKKLPCYCRCNSAPIMDGDEMMQLGEVVGKETAKERRQREKAIRKAKRKAAKQAARRERKRLQREKAKREREERRKKESDEGGEESSEKNGYIRRHLGQSEVKEDEHYDETSVLMACCTCSDYPCHCKANMLVFRMDND